MSTTAPFERRHTFQPPAETVAEQAQTREDSRFRPSRPVLVHESGGGGSDRASMWGLSALVLAILGLSGVLAMYMSPVAGIVLGVAFLMLGGVGAAWAACSASPNTRLSGRIVFSKQRGRRVDRGVRRSRLEPSEFRVPWGRAVCRSGGHRDGTRFALAQRSHAAREPLHLLCHLSRRGRTPAQRPVCHQRAVVGTGAGLPPGPWAA